MSRVGKCIDNGPMEAFWETLKSEMFYGVKFDNLLILKRKIEEYIYFYNNFIKRKIEEYIYFYNNFRIQSNLKGMTPNEHRYHAYSSFIYF